MTPEPAHYYHVWITLRSHAWPGVYKLDLKLPELTQRVVIPYRQNKTMEIAGQKLDPSDIERVEIHATDRSSDQLRAEAQQREQRSRVIGVPSEYYIFELGRDVSDELLSPIDLPDYYVPGVAETQPTQQGMRVLDLMWRKFAKTWQWPTIREIDNDIYGELHLDGEELLKALPPGLVTPETSGQPFLREDGELGLTLRGLKLVPDAEELLDLYTRAVAHMVEEADEFRPADATEYLKVTSKYIAEALRLDPSDSRLGAIFTLLREGLPGFWRGMSKTADSWDVTVNERGARRYRGVNSIDELIARREQIIDDQFAAAPHLRPAASRGLLTELYGSAEGLSSTGVDETVTGSTTAPGTGTVVEPLEQGDPQKVFLVHGRNTAIASAMGTFLESIHLSVVDFELDAVTATGSAAPYTGDIVRAGFSLARAVLVMFTPDETVELRQEYAASPDELVKHLQSRPNVYFEAGMAFISHPNRTILVEVGNVRPFSDIGGRHTVRLDDSPEARERLINRLRIAKCNVDDADGTWRTAGQFIDSP